MADLAEIEARMLRWVSAIGVLGTLGILLRGHLYSAVAFGIGALLGILNFYWLVRTVTVLLDSQVSRVSRKAAFLMIARYPLGFAGLLVVYYFGHMPVLPLIAGLLVPGGGVFIESLRLIVAGLREKQIAQ